MLQEKEVMQLLEETEAVLHGHFVDQWFAQPYVCRKIQCVAAS